MLRQNRDILIPHIDEARLLESESFRILRLRVGDSDLRNDAAVSMADNHDEYVASSNLL